jgi:hypothetical protein
VNTIVTGSLSEHPDARPRKRRAGGASFNIVDVSVMFLILTTQEEGAK